MLQKYAFPFNPPNVYPIFFRFCPCWLRFAQKSFKMMIKILQNDFQDGSKKSRKNLSKPSVSTKKI